MKMDQILEQVDGAIGIADDVVVYAKSEEERGKIQHRLMQIAAENGFVFNSTKCKIKSKSISFFGMIYSENGVSPNTEKLKDQQSMPYPTCKKELQEFLGLITYLSLFIPNLADKTHTLRGLLKKDGPFLWEERHKEYFEKLKTVISQDSMLTYFNTTEIPVLQTDASQKGFGAALIQNKNKKNNKKQKNNHICIKISNRRRKTVCTHRKGTSCNCIWCPKISHIYMDVNLKYSLTISHLS